MNQRTQDEAPLIAQLTPDGSVTQTTRKPPGDAEAQGARRTPAYDVAAGTPDPEIPTLTIEDLGILLAVNYSPGDGVVVTITPTYSGCPAMREIAADVRARLNRAGFERVTVATQLSPPWSTDWITEEGHRKLAAVGIAPPSPTRRRTGPIPLTLGHRSLSSGALGSIRCPRCGSPDTRLTAQFSATACKSLHRCNACDEPFEAVKPI
jgi:ring-1,2-phenylacetyl-CoA epoxidase subunit PaaD